MFSSSLSVSTASLVWHRRQQRKRRREGRGKKVRVSKSSSMLDRRHSLPSSHLTTCPLQAYFSFSLFSWAICLANMFVIFSSCSSEETVRSTTFCFSALSMASSWRRGKRGEEEGEGGTRGSERRGKGRRGGRHKVHIQLGAYCIGRMLPTVREALLASKRRENCTSSPLAQPRQQTHACRGYTATPIICLALPLPPDGFPSPSFLF